jgi:uncharacterized membrane protein (GlpM family)
MFANHFVLKLLLTPFIIIMATLVARRWGERIGGLMIGLPLTSAPVSVFFAIEQGQRFASNAARGSLLGLIPVAAFCVGYARSARKFPWYLAAGLSSALYLVTVWGISFVSITLGWIVLAVISGLSLALIFIGHQDALIQPMSPPWWDLPMRILIATSILILITTAAGTMGPKWSGLLSPFPIFTFVMVTFAHSQGGPVAAGRLVRGVLTGLFAYLAFFIVVTLFIEHANEVAVYSLAALAALGVNALSLLTLLRSPHSAGAGQPEP